MIRKPRLGTSAMLLVLGFVALTFHLYLSSSYTAFSIGPSLFAPAVFDMFTILAAIVLLLAIVELRRAHRAVGPLLMTLSAVLVALAAVFFKVLPLL